jgi:fatty-acyl-CoA synthase
VTAADSNFGVGTWIERRARATPSAPALIVDERAVSYGELARRIRRTANSFRDLGVQHGDRVVWLGPNDAAFLESFFGVALIGAALAPINHRLPADDIDCLLADYEPALLIQHAAVEFEPARPITRLAVGGELARSRSYAATVAGATDDSVGTTVGLDELCLLPHSSGTTGRPKGIMLSHANVTWNAINVVASTGIRDDDVTVAIAPFFRTGGTGVNVLPVLFQGGTVIIPGGSSPGVILSAMERHKVTIGFANPDLLDALATAPEWPTSDLSAIRFILTGGAPVPEQLIRSYAQRGLALAQGYGLSEAAPVTHVLRPEDAPHKVGSAGQPVLMVDARVERADGSDAQPGEAGELLVRGPNVMLGYWRNAEATRAVLTDDGWLHTGDAARVDGQGFYWIVGRMADAFETAGRVVHPGDLERTLAAHPLVADVAVVDVRDGDAVRIVAVVVPRGRRSVSPDELRLPGVDEVIVVRRLPRSSVGKLRRDDVRRLAATALAEARPSGGRGP